MNQSIKYFVVAIASALFVTGLSSCGSGLGKMTEPYKDAERGTTNDQPADLITMPDGFSNIATKCVNGVRYSVVYHADSAYGSLSTVVDPNCP